MANLFPYTQLDVNNARDVLMASGGWLTAVRDTATRGTRQYITIYTRMKIFHRDSYRALFTSQSANVFSTHRPFFRIWTIAEGSFS